MTADEVRALLRKRLKTMKQAALAKTLDISAAYLSDILSGAREPGDKVLKALGLRRETSYVEGKARRRA